MTSDEGAAMVQLVDVRNMTAWMRHVGPEQVLRLVAAAIREDFARWPSFERSPRVPSHSERGVIELMPTSDGQLYGFKYVNGHPSNPAMGLQTVTAFGLLADVATGYPLFLAEMTVLTAFRTAATSAVVAAELARPDSRTMALIGAGGQAEFQTIAFRELVGVERVRVWDTDPAAIRKFVANAGRLGVEVVVATSAADAVAGADIITTCTADKTNAQVLRSRDVAAGVHINAIGGDCPGKTELDAAILERADVFVEHTAQTRIEGEIQQMAADFPVTEFWEVLTGAHPGRRSRDAVTVFDSVGFAIEDFSALRAVRDAVNGTAFVSEVDLVADPADPKDLFGLLAPAGLPV